MTDELFLIAHKVRGEPAFDIAMHMTCPTCEGTNDHCHQCDGVGHWWIIPTSGHRAYPLLQWKLGDLASISEDIPWSPHEIQLNNHEGWHSLRDHYTTEATIATDLIKVLGLIHKPLGSPLPPIKRRL